jgi:DNA-3-methyladenine glycosylase II
MALRRPDVWPTGDLALAVALRDIKRMRRLPSRERQQAVAARWAPYRSVAARLLWAHYLAGRGTSAAPAARYRVGHGDA